jgi:hypothetical protein
MTDDRRIEYRISAWLEEEAVGDLPDRVLDSVFEQTRVARRPSRFAGRLQQMSRSVSGLIAVGAAAIVLVIFGVALLAARPPSAATGSPVPSASSAAAVYPTPAPRQTDLPSTVPSPTGPSAETIDATAFAVPFTMLWPERVQLPLVWPDGVQVRPRYGTSFTMLLIGQVGADPCHNQKLIETPLRTPQEFMDWLAAIPHVSAQPIQSVTVGGQPALQRDLDISPLNDCQDQSTLYSGIHSRLDDGYPGGFYFGPGKVRWTAMTVKGQLIAFMLTPLESQAFVTEANQAISTLQFLP